VIVMAPPESGREQRFHYPSARRNRHPARLPAGHGVN
jgi:hypothetical protein